MKINDKTKYLNNPFESSLKNNEIKEAISAPRYNPKHLEQTRNSLPPMEKHL